VHDRQIARDGLGNARVKDFDGHCSGGNRGRGILADGRSEGTIRLATRSQVRRRNEVVFEGCTVDLHRYQVSGIGVGLKYEPVQLPLFRWEPHQSPQRHLQMSVEISALRPVLYSRKDGVLSEIVRRRTSRIGGQGRDPSWMQPTGRAGRAVRM